MTENLSMEAHEIGLSFGSKHLYIREQDKNIVAIYFVES